jgi:hypothetical protein
MGGKRVIMREKVSDALFWVLLAFMAIGAWYDAYRFAWLGEEDGPSYAYDCETDSECEGTDQ